MLTEDSVAEGAKQPQDDEADEDYHWAEDEASEPVDNTGDTEDESQKGAVTDGLESIDEDWYDNLPSDSEESIPDEKKDDDLLFNEKNGFWYHPDDIIEDEVDGDQMISDDEDDDFVPSASGITVSELESEDDEEDNGIEEESSQPAYHRQDAMVFDEDGNDITPDKEAFDNDDWFDEEWDGPIGEDPTACNNESCQEEEEQEEVAVTSLFFVMFTVLAVMLFAMWMMLRQCQKPILNEEDEHRRKRGSYVPTRISTVDDDSIELRDVEAYV